MASSRKGPPPTASAAGLPLFYRNPTVLRFEEHKGKALAPRNNFRFAAGTNVVPISVGEFAQASSHYPIAFVEGDLAPVALLGLRQGQNDFLTPDGTWQSDAYVPAYLRRYPFALAQVPGRDARVLMIDAASERFIDTVEGKPEWRIFSEDGQAMPTVAEMMTFCEAFHHQHLLGVEFVNALKEADLLVSRHTKVTFPDQSKYQLGGFRMVDPGRFRALSGQTLERWHQNGWLDAVALHLASQKNWRTLMKRSQNKAEAA